MTSLIFMKHWNKLLRWKKGFTIKDFWSPLFIHRSRHSAELIYIRVYLIRLPAFVTVSQRITHSETATSARHFTVCSSISAFMIFISAMMLPRWKKSLSRSLTAVCPLMNSHCGWKIIMYMYREAVSVHLLPPSQKGHKKAAIVGGGNISLAYHRGLVL